MNNTEIIKYLETKRFATRGLPFAKKMWRDGYNKCLDEVIIYLQSQEQKKDLTDEDL